MKLASSENITVEKMAELLARRAVLQKHAQRSMRYEMSLSDSDTLKQAGYHAIDGDHNKQAANQYIDQAKNWWKGTGTDTNQYIDQAKNWWKGMGTDTKQTLRNAGIGAAAGGLGGVAMNMLGTDEDSDRRNPIQSGLTGALAGGAIGGFGTMGYQQLNKAKETSKGSDDLGELADLHDRANERWYNHLGKSVGEMNKQIDPSSGKSVANTWPRNFEDVARVSPTEAGGYVGGAGSAAIVTNDILHNRRVASNRPGNWLTRNMNPASQVDMTTGVDEFLKSKPALSSALTNTILTTPRYQEELRRAAKAGKSWTIPGNAKGVAGYTLSSQGVKDLMGKIEAKARIKNPLKPRSVKKMTARAGLPLVAGLAAQPIADIVGGILLRHQGSQNAGEELALRERLKKMYK